MECEIFRIVLKHASDHLSVTFQFTWLHLSENLLKAASVSRKMSIKMTLIKYHLISANICNNFSKTFYQGPTYAKIVFSQILSSTIIMDYDKSHVSNPTLFQRLKKYWEKINIDTIIREKSFDRFADQK